MTGGMVLGIALLTHLRLKIQLPIHFLQPAALGVSEILYMTQSMVQLVPGQA